MLITHKFKMALDRRGVPATVDAVQGNKNTRAVEITLLCGNQPWEVPEGVSVMVRFGKPDGTGGTYDTLEDGSSAVTVAGNVITAILAKQVLTVPGCVRAQVELVKDDQEMATFAFVILVEPDPSVGAMDSEDYVNLSGYVSDEVHRILDDEGVRGAGTFWVHATLDYEAGTAEVLESAEEIYAAYEANMNCCMRATVTNPVTDAKQILILQTAEKSPTANGTHYRIAFHQLSSYEERYEGTGEWVTRAVLDEVVVSKFDDEIQNVCFRTRVLTDDDQAGSGNVDLSEYAKKDELPKLYEVTITDNGDGTYTSDHYYADIKAAYESGRIPIAVMGTSRYQLTTLPKFASQGVLFGKQDGQIYSNIKITGNAVKVSTTTFVTPDDIPDFPNTDPFYLLISTVSDEDGYFSILGWMDGSTPTLETGLTACYNAYMQGRAVFARFEGGGEKPVELPIPCTYCDEQMAIFTWNMYGKTIQLFATEGIAELTSFDIGNCIVSVTGNDADGYTTDKSYDELMTAYEFGQTLACEYEGVRLPFVTINEDMFQFSISMGGCMTMMVLVGDGFASMATLEGTITINNVMWRGEEPMDFTDTINAMIDAKLAEIPSGASANKFCVSFVVGYPENTADKGYAEIEAARAAGKRIYGMIPGDFANILLPDFYADVHEGTFAFRGTVSRENNSGGMVTEELTVLMRSDGAIENFSSMLVKRDELADIINTMIDAKLAEIPNASGVSF